MANYSVYVHYLCQRTSYLMVYATVMVYFLMIVSILLFAIGKCCKCIKKKNLDKIAEHNKILQFLKYFYRLVSWLTRQLYGKQMMLTKDDNKNYSILTLDGRRHKIDNKSQLTCILGWMFLSELSVIISIIVLAIMKFSYHITISNTCWYGLNTDGTDCFPTDIDENNFTCATFGSDISPVNCNEWNNTISVICFKKEYFPLSMVVALLTPLIKFILPILMDIVGLMMNIIGSIGSKCCDWPLKSNLHLFTIYTCTYTISIKLAFFPILATLIISTDLDDHWIRNLESKGYGYIEDIIVGIFVFIPELLIFPWEDLRKLRIEEDNIIFSDCQNKYETLEDTINTSNEEHSLI